MLGTLLGDKNLKNTEAVYAGKTFKDNYKGKIGNVNFEIHHPGRSHTPGDSFVWFPEKKIVFTGDIVYVERMLGVIEVSSSKSWLHAFETMASFSPKILVPGHGKVTNIEHARKDTYDYLVFLRNSVATFIDEGIGIESIGKLNQSKYQYLKNYETLKGRNAQKVYQELEWE